MKMWGERDALEGVAQEYIMEKLHVLGVGMFSCERK